MKTEIFYHGSYVGKIEESKKSCNCFYITPSFSYAAFYSADNDNNHGCVYKMKFKKNLKIFDARKTEDISLLKEVYRGKINVERLKDEDWSTVCGKALREEILLFIKSLGYDGYLNFEWDDINASYFSEVTMDLAHTKAIGIFDVSNLEIIDTKKYDDYFEDEKFCKLQKMEKNVFQDMIDNKDFETFYEAEVYAGDKFKFLEIDEVDGMLFDSYLD